MSTPKRSTVEQLDALIDAYLEDLQEVPESELLADPKRVEMQRATFDKLLRSATLEAGKRRLAHARAELAAKSRDTKLLEPIDLAEARRYYSQVEVPGIIRKPEPRKTAAGEWLQSLSSAERKEVAVSRGLFAYFPDALALVARHSVRSNEKHNPGQPVHWSREKSADHEDCIARHSIAVAVDPDAMDGDAPHIICRAWRALAALQVWIEEQRGKVEK